MGTQARGSRGRNCAAGGFSLLELLIVTTMVSLTALLAVPSLQAFLAAYERSNIRQQFEADLRRARNEALANGALALLRLEPLTDPMGGGANYRIGLDFVPYNSPADYDEVRYTRNLPDQQALGRLQDLRFDARGLLVDASGALTSAAVVLSQDGAPFATAVIYPAGSVEFQ